MMFEIYIISLVGGISLLIFPIWNVSSVLFFILGAISVLMMAFPIWSSWLDKPKKK